MVIKAWCKCQNLPSNSFLTSLYRHSSERGIRIFIQKKKRLNKLELMVTKHSWLMQEPHFKSNSFLTLLFQHSSEKEIERERERESEKKREREREKRESNMIQIEMLIKFSFNWYNSDQFIEREKERESEWRESERESNSIRNVHYFCFNIIMLKYNSSLMKSLFCEGILGIWNINNNITFLFCSRMSECVQYHARMLDIVFHNKQ